MIDKNGIEIKVGDDVYLEHETNIYGYTHCIYHPNAAGLYQKIIGLIGHGKIIKVGRIIETDGKLWMECEPESIKNAMGVACGTTQSSYGLSEEFAKYLEVIR